MLFIDDKTTQIRREIITELVRLYFEEGVDRVIDTLPMRIIPRNVQPIRICIHKESGVESFRLALQDGHAQINHRLEGLFPVVFQAHGDGLDWAGT